MLTWLQNFIGKRYLSKITGWALGLLNGKKRWLAGLAFVGLQTERVIANATNVETFAGYLHTVNEVLANSITAPTEVDLGIWGAIAVALFDALRKELEKDGYLKPSKQAKFRY